MDVEDEQPATRRRGSALEAAILEAAWEQLSAHGYGGFTFDAVAQRAQTSKPVLYRRWPTRVTLLEATIRWRGSHDRLSAPDTGTLREDVLALLRDANTRPERFLALFSALAGGLYDETGLSPGDLREQYLSSDTTAIEQVVLRAIIRGDIDPARATRLVIDLPFDLFRMNLFLRMGAVPDSDLVAIVDQAFLPLLLR